MLILQPKSVDPTGGLDMLLYTTRELAMQMMCYSEDMEYVPDRLDLMKLPPSMHPRSCAELGHIFQHHPAMVCVCYLQVKEHWLTRPKARCFTHIGRQNGVKYRIQTVVHKYVDHMAA